MSKRSVGSDGLRLRNGESGGSTAGRGLGRLASIALTLTLLAIAGLAEAAGAELEAFAGAVGGVPNTGVPGPCSTYSGTPPDAFFGSGLMSVPVGGIAACGYSGDLSDVIDTVGPVSANESVGPVLLGNPGSGTYVGDAVAEADSRLGFWEAAHVARAAAPSNVLGGHAGTLTSQLQNSDQSTVEAYRPLVHRADARRRLS